MTALARKVHSWKASPIRGDVMNDLVLHFDVTVPDVDGPQAYRLMQRQYESEGDRVEAELFSHLPGGLYDQILRAMLARKASILRVSHPDSIR